MVRKWGWVGHCTMIVAENEDVGSALPTTQISFSSLPQPVISLLSSLPIPPFFFIYFHHLFFPPYVFYSFSLCYLSFSCSSSSFLALLSLLLFFLLFLSLIIFIFVLNLFALIIFLLYHPPPHLTPIPKLLFIFRHPFLLFLFILLNIS